MRNQKEKRKSDLKKVDIIRGLKNGSISFIFVMVMCFGLVAIPNADKYVGTKDSIMNHKYILTNYIRTKFSGKDDVKVSFDKEKKLNSNNYNQADIRNYYNNRNGKAKDIPDSQGVCWASAITSLLKYNKCSGTGNKIAYDVFTTARINGYWEANIEGLAMAQADNLVTKMFKLYNVEKKGNNDYYNIYKTLTEEVDDGRVVLFSIKEHLMTGCGYLTYDVSYTQKNIFGKKIKKNTKEKFVIVNDTGANNNVRQYSYFPEREIGKNVVNRWEFGICKVRKK